MRFFPIIAILALAGACGGSGDGDGGAQSGPPPAPEPFLQSPFSGAYPTANLLDHDLPRQFSDSNGHIVDHAGVRRKVGEPGAHLDGHEGYDWLMPSGTPLVAAAPGVVRVAGDTAPHVCPALPNSPTVSNKEVVIEHERNGVHHRIRYVHLSSVAVSVGASVSAGQPIGESGNSGCSTTPHLHFQVYRLVTRASGTQEWITVDPYGWSGSAPDPWAQHPDGASSHVLWNPGQAPSLALQ